MLLVIILSSFLTASLLLLLQIIGVDYFIYAFDYFLIFTVSLLFIILGLTLFHEKIWNKLSLILKPKVEEVSIYVSQQIAILRDALLTADISQIEVVSNNLSNNFSKWYQKYLFRRFLIRSIIGLVVATAGLTTLVLWKKQNEILKGQLSAVSEQVSLQRQQWFLSQRTELMSLLYDRVICDSKKCPHLANLRTRTQAAITLVKMGKNELNSNLVSSSSNDSVIIQPESLFNLSYIDLSDYDKKRQLIQGHGSYLANLDWGSVALVYSNLDYSSLASSDFSNAKMQYASLKNTNINGTIFKNVFAMGADFTNAFGEKTNFIEAGLTNSNFTEANLVNANFSGAVISGARFNRSTLNGANFRTTKGVTCKQLSTAKSTIGVKLPEGLNCDLN